MKAIVCELCNSNEFTKLEDGNYQCDYCRTKYTPVQAKALFVEGVVKVDRTDEVGKFLALASNAFAAGNYAETYEYANRILEIDHKHPHAWFLKGASAGWGSTLDNCHAKLREMEQCFRTGSQALASSDREKYLKESGESIRKLVGAIYGHSLRQTREFITLPNSWDEHLNRSTALMASVRGAYDLTGDPRMLKVAIRIACANIEGELVSEPNNSPHVKQVSPATKAALTKSIVEWAGLVRRKEPNYRVEIPETKQVKSGCFIVTATFGNEDAGQVVLLKAFRDEVLARTATGRRFIEWYYRWSPRAAEVISRSRLLRGAVFVVVVVPATLVALPSLLVSRLLHGAR